MRSFSLCFLLCLQLFLFLSLSYSFGFAFPSCRTDQSSALLDFKNSFSIQKPDPASSFTSYVCAYFETLSYPKTSNWKNGTNCCLWDGITCNPRGDVISLNLNCSWLHGKLLPNNSLFQLIHLQRLDLGVNDFDGSQVLSNFSQLVSLTHLSLRYSNFMGEVPSHISHLHKLVSLYLSEIFNHLILRENTWERLKRNVTHIKNLQLNYVDMSLIPSSHLLKNLSSSLVTLYLKDARLQGNLDENIFSFPHLQEILLRYNPNLTCYLLKSNRSNSIRILDLSYCQLIGEIPPSLWNLTQLTFLALSNNNFIGQISSSLSNLKNLTHLDLSSNNFSAQFPCAISELKNLQHLDLSNNSFHGTIPSWFFTLPSFNYSMSWKAMYFLDLSSNSLQGELFSSICNARTLDILNLSYNNFTGTIPHCIVSSNLTLSVLDLQMNSFSGTIPESFEVGNNLRTLNLNDNFLKGSLPQSLVNCKSLTVLDLGNNGIEDVFPHWLQELEELQVIVLRENKLHGFIPDFKDNRSHAFHMLRVLDLSSNNLKGPLPASFFKSFKAMGKLHGNTRLKYLSYGNSTYSFRVYQNSIELTWKGLDIHLKNILNIFTFIDLSNNMFEGEIPQVIGELRALRGLNFSHNVLTGAIPSSMENLRNLEWLDLSSNNFTGKIPIELINLNFLGVLNLSMNQLEGCIPRGQQFETFSSDSFKGNKELRGFQLMIPCITLEERQQPLPTSEVGFEFGWKPVVLGYVCGAAFGATLFQVVMFTGKPQWIVSLVNDPPKKRKRRVRNHP